MINTLFRSLFLTLLIFLFSTAHGQDPVNKKEYPYDSVSAKQKQSGSKKKTRNQEEGNPIPHRYMLSPSGRGMKKSTFNYQNIGIGINMLNAGVSDHFSIDIGLIPAFLIPNVSTVLIGIHPKVSLPISKNIHAGIGLFYGGYLGDGGNGAIGLGYGVLTFGSEDKNISLGFGYGFKNFRFSPTLTAAATYKIGPRSYLIAENFFLGRDFESNLNLVLVGGRSIFRLLSLDYGIAIPLDKGNGRFYALPWLGATFPLR